MANVIDYLDWRGDLTFAKSNFNDVDNLILALLSYIPYENIVEGYESNQAITIREAYFKYKEIYAEGDPVVGVLISKEIFALLRKAAACK